MVANAGSDTLSVIDTRTDKIVETICARQNPGDLFGAQPDALAFDKSGKTFCLQWHAERRRGFSVQTRQIEIARPDSRRLVSRRDCV